jgi:phosphoserine phosphatase
MDLPTITSAALIEKLEEERRRTASLGEAPLIAFDADGTLWSGDVGCDIFNALVRVNGVREESASALLAEAAEFGIAVSGTSTEIARVLDAAVSLGRYPEARGLAMVAWAFAGWEPPAVDAFACEVATDVRLEARIYPEILPVLAWAEERGVESWVVSASPRAMAVAGAALVGVPAERVVAMTPALEGGRIAARLEGFVTYDDGKRDALRAAKPLATVLGAFGDSGYDAALLREARLRVAVHPKRSLIAAAGSIPGLLRLLG